MPNKIIVPKVYFAGNLTRAGVSAPWVVRHGMKVLSRHATRDDADRAVIGHTLALNPGATVTYK